tara:strand:- start:228 stop:452 length:225 start_codon:yes stop_codon:yes gene_type:complete
MGSEMEENTNTKLTIKYNSDSLGEQVAIEDMNPQHLVNALYKSARERGVISPSAPRFEVHKTEIGELIWPYWIR